MENKEDPAPADPASSKYHYEQRCLRLEGELHDADRKNRHLLDEIVQLKRALSEDRTETLLTHQQEIAEAKEAHRNNFDRLKCIIPNEHPHHDRRAFFHVLIR